MDQKTCEHCQAVFELIETHLIQRDEDSIQCPECKKTLISWNGGVTYRIKKLVKKGNTSK